jgi:hypothetical protein
MTALNKKAEFSRLRQKYAKYIPMDAFWQDISGPEIRRDTIAAMRNDGFAFKVTEVDRIRNNIKKRDNHRIHTAAANPKSRSAQLLNSQVDMSVISTNSDDAEPSNKKPSRASPGRIVKKRAHPKRSTAKRFSVRDLDTESDDDCNDDDDYAPSLVDADSEFFEDDSAAPGADDADAVGDMQAFSAFSSYNGLSHLIVDEAIPLSALKDADRNGDTCPEDAWEHSSIWLPIGAEEPFIPSEQMFPEGLAAGGEADRAQDLQDLHVPADFDLFFGLNGANALVLSDEELRQKLGLH